VKAEVAPGEGPSSKPRQRGRSRELVLVLAAIVLVGAGLVALTLAQGSFPLKSYRVESATMEPTLKAGDVVTVDRVTYRTHEPAVGDLVVYRMPREVMIVKRPFLKRIVAVAGDRIAVRQGKLRRNGAAANEPYIKESMTYTWPDEGELTVPEGHVVVLGDNRNYSNDSHHWTRRAPNGTEESAPFLPVTNIIGKAIQPTGAE